MEDTSAVRQRQRARLRDSIPPPRPGDQESQFSRSERRPQLGPQGRVGENRTHGLGLEDGTQIRFRRQTVEIPFLPIVRGGKWIGGIDVRVSRIVPAVRDLGELLQADEHADVQRDEERAVQQLSGSTEAEHWGYYRQGGGADRRGGFAGDRQRGVPVARRRSLGPIRALRLDRTPDHRNLLHVSRDQFRRILHAQLRTHVVHRRYVRRIGLRAGRTVAQESQRHGRRLGVGCPHAKGRGERREDLFASPSPRPASHCFR
mmetsp:Transcript_29560/g.87566  ORF Transcript_29560/g.87566 Transcript_29560/m.87566 type:complete len:260 (+) Transcript_29560:476-1255(+)